MQHNTHVVCTDQAFSDWFALKTDEVVGNPLSKFLHPADHKRVEDVLHIARNFAHAALAPQQAGRVRRHSIASDVGEGLTSKALLASPMLMRGQQTSQHKLQHSGSSQLWSVTVGVMCDTADCMDVQVAASMLSPCQSYIALWFM